LFITTCIEKQCTRALKRHMIFERSLIQFSNFIEFISSFIRLLRSRLDLQITEGRSASCLQHFPLSLTIE